MLNFQRHLVNCRFLFLQGSSVSSIVCFLHLQYCDSDAEKRAILRSQFQKLGGDLKFYSASSLNVFLSDHVAIAFFGNFNLKGGGGGGVVHGAPQHQGFPGYVKGQAGGGDLAAQE